MITDDVGTCSWLVEELAAARLVERDQLAPFLADFTAECPYADADAFAVHLAREGVLSKFQAKRALDGDAKKLMLGAYVLTEVIGSGSLGPVYKAFGRADQKPYAIKVLPRRAWSVRLARSQVRAFDELPPHDSIVPFIDVGTAHGSHYFVWPFCEGRTLESIIREFGPLSPGEVARIGVRLGEVLKLCLTRGLIHGMIKPGNVFVGGDGQVRLLDFGVGALLAENPEDELLVDTVSRAGALAHIIECAAPESIADSTKWAPAADQYSLGCTLYFCLTGRFPFPGGTFVDKIINHQTKKPMPIRSLNPDVPPGLIEIVDRLMNKAPGDRYQRLDELIRDLTPLATVSRIQPPVPVNIETPAPMARLVLTPPAQSVQAAPSAQEIEPPVLELPDETSGRGLLGRFFGKNASKNEVLHAAIVAAGPVEPGQTVVLHIYIHGPGDEKGLAEAARRERVRLLGTARTKRCVARSALVGLHLNVTGAVVGEPMQEFEREPGAMIYRFAVAIPDDAPSEPLKSRLMVGQEGRLIAQVDFVIPIVGS